MANEEHLAILKQGVDIWNKWREESPFVQPDLSYANLRRRNLSGIDLTGAGLRYTDLTKADLRGANFDVAEIHVTDLTRAQVKGATFRNSSIVEAVFEGADARSVTFRGAEISHVEFGEANLRSAVFQDITSGGTTFEGADLTKTNFRNARLRLTFFDGANLAESVMGWTTFEDVDLSQASGLDSVKHQGPLYLDIHTIYSSEGQIPEAFLRGAGLPDTFIAFARSLALAERPIDYHSCFISYSSRDEDFAKRLHADLQDNGVRCWFAPEDMKIGDKIRQRIDESIRIHDKLLLVLSDNSIDSQWVEKEVATAWEEEHKRGETVLFPVTLDDSVMETNQAWAADIRRQRHIGDFRQWKQHDNYREAFGRLLRDLKAAN